MCEICAASACFEPQRHTNQSSNGATITEILDASADINTSYQIDPGDVFNGTIDTAFERDWVAIDLTAGTSYVIDQLGSSSGNGTLSDPFIRLRDANGDLIASNDDSGVGFDSSLAFTASVSGTYYVEAGAYSSETGTYKISVQEKSPANVGTLDEMATFLTDGFWGGRQIAFNTSSSNVITVDLSGLTADGQQLARWAMDAWEMVIDLDFVEVTSGAQIVMDDEQSGAFAYAPNSAPQGTAELNISRAWIDTYGTDIGSYSFQTYLHEIGHAIGLGHQGAYNGSANYSTDAEFLNDSWQMSVMSYFSQNENTLTDASYGEVITPMMVDILAAQNLYGAPGSSSATSGNTIYGSKNSNLGNFLDDVFDQMDNGTGQLGGGNMPLTIYDEGGIDTLDYAYLVTDNRFDLRAEQFSDVGGRIGNLGIARGTEIENLKSGSGDDEVMGNTASNNIQVNEGRDTVLAGNGKDTVVGGSGADLLRGENGNDLIYGDDGNDALYGGAQNDTIHGGNGGDLVWGGDGMDVAYLDDGNDIFNDTAQNDPLGNDTVYGGNGDDIINGGGGDDVFNGENGRDLLFGDLGNDKLIGGRLFDTIHGGEGDDTVEAGNGRDKVFLDQGNDLFTDEIQNDKYGRDTVYGGEGDDTILADGGDDVLHGNQGIDSITGGLGNDRIFAGGGNDIVRAGTGNDFVRGGNGKDLIYLDAGNDVFVDAEQNSTYGSDTVFGGEGNDTFFAGGGDDVFTGGTGADDYVFDVLMSHDVITDFVKGTDDLHLSSALVGGRNAASVVNDLASVTGDGVLLNFGNDQSLLLEGLTSTNGLLDDISIL